MEKYYTEPAADIYCGNAMEVLKSLPDESVQMCMCSPPYWGLRNYSGSSSIAWGGDSGCEHVFEGTENFCTKCKSWRGQLGLEPTPSLYAEHLMMIFHEVKRVLKKTGSFYLNIGDTYSATPAGNKEFYRWQHGNRPEKDMNAVRVTFDKTLIAVPKCMICIPERIMFALIDDGWILRNKCIWRKPNSMPGSQKDRFTAGWEYVYFFVKNNTTCLWRNRITGEWRDTRPTREENYPWGGIYQNVDTEQFRWDKPSNKEAGKWIRYMPLWAGFDYYFDLDAVRVPHKSDSLERYQRGVNLDRPSIGKSGEVGPMQQYTRAPQWFKEMFPPDKEYKGKFDDLFGHGPNPQSFNLRVRDVKRGKCGATAQDGELKASEKEIKGYEYPEKQPSARQENILYGGLESPDGVHCHPVGKNPGDMLEPDDYWEISTHPFKGAHFAVYPEALCRRPILASSRVGDTVLDPFAGSGTTGVVAKELGRKAILIDVVPAYCKIERERLSKVEYQPRLLDK